MGHLFSNLFNTNDIKYVKKKKPSLQQFPIKPHDTIPTAPGSINTEDSHTWNKILHSTLNM